MPDSFATASDVADRWRPLTSAETVVADTLVNDASDMIRRRWADIDSRISTGSVSSATMVRIVAGMVKRAMLVSGAEGVEQQSQNAGPFALTQKFSNPNGNLYLSQADIADLEPDGYVPHARTGWLA